MSSNSVRAVNASLGDGGPAAEESALVILEIARFGPECLSNPKDVPRRWITNGVTLKSSLLTSLGSPSCWCSIAHVCSVFNTLQHGK
jgi:hypothetical protein